ncbi:MAG: DUF4910 domain-containing protein [Ignisphaera sp.]
MVNISNIYNSLESFYSKQELLWMISSISRFHRIQGSSELEKAVDYIAENLLDLENFEIKTYRFSYGERYGIHYDIVGWDVEDGFVSIVKPKHKILSRFLSSKTAVVAHSPKGDVEAEVVYVADGLDINRYRDVDDKIVLSYGSPYIVYRTGCRFGASGFIFFKKDAYEEAVPYIGLFLSREDTKTCKAPAVSISRHAAIHIINSIEKGHKVVARIYVESSFRAEAYIPVLELSLGDGEREIHAYAHICHPAGTVNDNVSGVVALIELAKAIDKALNKDRISYPRYRKIMFVLFPEYYGPLPYLLEKTKFSDIEFSINLDMIGERQWITNSTLHFISPPTILSNKLYEGLILKLLNYSLCKVSTFSSSIKTLSYRFDVVPYDSGSDHDVYLQFQIPSVMINQWPDTYYHTDMDTIDKFDPEITSYISIAIGVAIYTQSLNQLSESTKKDIEDMYTHIIEGYRELRKEKEDTIFKKAEDIEDTAIYRYVAPKGIISVRHLYNYIGFEDVLNIMSDLENKFMYHLFSRYIPLILLVRPMNIYEIARHIEQDYGKSIAFKDIKKILNYLYRMGIIVKDQG